MRLREHLHQHHAKYYRRMRAALKPDEAKVDDPQREQKRLHYLAHARRSRFPAWAYKTDRLFPSQIIPDRIVIPTQVDKDGTIKYMCSIDPCSDHAIDSGFGIHLHMMEQHGQRYDLLLSRRYHGAGLRAVAERFR
ncbi:uncharacterized protein LOC129587372 isoform X2 [Paramacrobiotus metropolitanus]|uniref:uncharacterized protein LOC129587372 isoform X2 n=1 Tax=Paramacrobiotus metropolitanus TaxID=2943436 RepID=UPI002445F20E|nr:uncharacterized protein LOC129587372 isoform X2 [Paramacrobiotus metropolitanus]